MLALAIFFLRDFQECERYLIAAHGIGQARAFPPPSPLLAGISVKVQYKYRMYNFHIILGKSQVCPISKSSKDAIFYQEKDMSHHSA